MTDEEEEEEDMTDRFGLSRNYDEPDADSVPEHTDEAPTTAAAENDNVVIDIAALFDEDGPGTAGAELEPSNP